MVTNMPYSELAIWEDMRMGKWSTFVQRQELTACIKPTWVRRLMTLQTNVAPFPPSWAQAHCSSLIHLSSWECFCPLPRQVKHSSFRRISILRRGHLDSSSAPIDTSFWSVDRKHLWIPQSFPLIQTDPFFSLFAYSSDRFSYTHLSHLETMSMFRLFLTLSKLQWTTSDLFENNVLL